MHSHAISVSKVQTIGRLTLGLFLLLAGISHLTFLRTDFQAQVPDWLPMNVDLVVILSGIVEISLGAALLVLAKQKFWVGLIVAIFFICVFPGNISQYLDHKSAFGLDTDRARFTRLFFQPVLIVWALWSTGAWANLKVHWRKK
jgi:uncharacterized membrane protein